LVAAVVLGFAAGALGDTTGLQLTENDALEEHGLSVFLFHNHYHPVFGDEKNSGLQIIFHEQRVANNGDVRLESTPAQWDAIPVFRQRKRGPAANELMATLEYPEKKFSYAIDVRPEQSGIRVAVVLERALPAELAGRAGFNLEFLPTAYFGKSYVIGDRTGVFPRYPGGPMAKNASGEFEPVAMGSGQQILLSPEDAATRVSIVSEGAALALFDGRNKAQNGWFVVRSELPAEKTGEVVVWHIGLKVAPGWVRKPVVGYNQVGYTPERRKVAVLELDAASPPEKTARVVSVRADGGTKEVFRGEVKLWGKWLRYRYATFDFSALREPGLYAIEYAGTTSGPFRVAKDVYDGIWHNSLDTFLAEQMDHVKVREGYRTWHGISHLDDARQAPVDYTHFDGYAQGPTTDSPFAPGQHIPGLNVGGWFDAGDFDLRTQTHERVITDLVVAREKFGMDWDGTTVDEKTRYVEIRRPDGVPDAIEQIRHGVLYLLAQYRTFGHAIPGVIDPTLQEYTFLGDAASKTDGKIYSEKMGPSESDGIYSGLPDDRWAFTTHTTPLNYGAASALAAASRVLRGVDDAMAEECLRTSEKVWDEEHRQEPALFHSFNTTGGDLRGEEIKLAVELLLATKGGEPYRKRLMELLPEIESHVAAEVGTAARAIPWMGGEYKEALRGMTAQFKSKLDEGLAKNPYGVPISMGTWGGSGLAVEFATRMYFLHEAFPELIGAEYTLRGLDYVLGVHPASNVSYVAGIGAQSKLIGYGNNRADYTFIPGGMIPGVTVIQPDFPELMSEWPFLWYENEYVVDAGTGFVLLANAGNALAEEKADK
jgi:hypothetical protein